MTACGSLTDSLSQVEAYNAKPDEVHLVVAAPLASRVEQRLWVCQGTKVRSGTRASGYIVSIGIGAGPYANVATQTASNRNKSGSNLTPVGEFRISRKIGWTCAPGMTTRCMSLQGQELGVNNNAKSRGIFIHGTPQGNYPYLGNSASHGCVRMKNDEVITIYNNVAEGTRVYINSSDRAVGAGNPCSFVGDTNGRAR